ncbi:MAG: restriction endonuclease subunit S [Oleispira sp.]|nr:restriction endonuclease subunit S [Oleispira sp.]MBL4880560.1 restriction endonuclease subunit S [Oleispira sp.]
MAGQIQKTEKALTESVEKTEQVIAALNGTAKGIVNAGGNNGVPEGWVRSELGDIISVSSGKGLTKSKMIEGSIPVYGGNGVTGWHNVPNIDEKTIVIGRVGFYCGSVHVTPVNAWVTDNAFITKYSKKNISQNFLYRLLVSTDLRQNDSGSAQPVISGGKLYPIRVLLPPLAEQTAIAQTLDTLLAQVDSIKARLDAIPKILKTFRQSVLAAAVSGKLTEEWRGENECEITKDEILNTRFSNWCDKKIAEFSLKGKKQKNELWKDKYKLPELIEPEKIWTIPEKWCWSTIDAVSKVTKLAGFEFTKHVNYTDNGDLPVIKAENVGVNGYRHKSYSYVKSAEVEMLTRSELFGREILVVFVGAGVGQVGISPDDKKYFLGPNVAVVKQESNLYLPNYLDLYLKSLSGKGVLLSFSKGGAQPSLSMGQIRKASIPIPPIEEQTKIVSRVEELFVFADQIEQQVKNAQGRVNSLSQSILAKAFRGELTTQWRADNPDLISGENSAEALLAKIKEERDKLVIKKKPRTTKKKVAN